MKAYLFDVLKASSIGLTILPYVWLTNFTAQRGAILGHGALLWFFIPLCVAANRSIKTKVTTRQLPKGLLATIGNTATAITVATILMILAVHWISGWPFELLLVPPLFIALLPVYTCYVFFDLVAAWRMQREQALKLEVANNRMAWQTLSAQINPHFLFNSLNTVECLIESDPQLAQASIRHLSGLYRYILEVSTSEQIEIEGELKAVQDYIFVQALRFADRLSFESDLPPNMLKEKLPPHTLLTCVENAVKHGIEPSADHGYIRLRGTQSKTTNRFTLTNSISTNQLAKTRTGTGFGINSVQERLKLIHGEGAFLNLTNHNDHVVTTIEIPRKTQNAPAN